jgi:nucleoside-diphosphate-sugar epimerase
MTTLVTGATGFACVHIVRALAEAGELVVALDITPPDAVILGYLAHVQNRIRFITGDVLDARAMVAYAQEYGADRFVHGAAITPTVEVEKADPRRIVDVNLMGSVNLLEAARKVGATRFVFTSSSGVYAPSVGGDRLLTEDSRVRAGGLYSISKLACESILKRYKGLFGLSTVTGRMSSIYGPMERATATRRRPSTIYSLVRACLAGDPVAARGRKYRRTFTRAEDAATIWRDLVLAERLEHDTYNVSAGVAYSLEEVLEALQKVEPEFEFSYAQEGQEADVEISPDGDRPALDMSRARGEFGFEPVHTLEHGIQSYLAWARENPELLRQKDL